MINKAHKEHVCSKLGRMRCIPVAWAGHIYILIVTVSEIPFCSWKCPSLHSKCAPEGVLKRAVKKKITVEKQGRSDFSGC